MNDYMIFFKIIKKDEGGQVLALLAMCLMMLFAFMAATINVGNFVSHRVHAQSIADASALSGAVWMARSLNTISAINQVKGIGIWHTNMEAYEVYTRIGWWVVLIPSCSSEAAACLVAWIICFAACMAGCTWNVLDAWWDMRDEVDDTKKEIGYLTSLQEELNDWKLSAVITASMLLANDRSDGDKVALPILSSYTKPMACEKQGDSSTPGGFNFSGGSLFNRILGALGFKTLRFDWYVLERNYDKKTFVQSLKWAGAPPTKVWGGLFGKSDTVVGGDLITFALARPFIFGETYTINSGVNAEKLSLGYMIFNFDLPMKDTKWDVKLNRINLGYYEFGFGPINSILSAVNVVGKYLIKH